MDDTKFDLFVEHGGSSLAQNANDKNIVTIGSTEFVDGSDITAEIKLISVVKEEKEIYADLISIKRGH